MRHHQLTVRPRAVDDAGQPDTSEAAEAVARRFHEAYERLAPQHGYDTREESAKPWEDVPQENRELMVATARELIDSGAIAALCVPADFVVEGDFHMFNWLSQAAGPAGAGFLGNNAETTDGSGHWLVLEPEQPERQQRSRSRLAHRELRA